MKNHYILVDVVPYIPTYWAIQKTTTNIGHSSNTFFTQDTTKTLLQARAHTSADEQLEDRQPRKFSRLNVQNKTKVW